ncbi:hypothetical protein ABPG77_002269 [Micractinium sp. CCAP 211/92]
MTELHQWSQEDVRYMRAALQQACIALEDSEVPVGCVVVRDGRIAATGSNKTNEERNGTRHAEFVAIDSLLAEAGGEPAAARFQDCDLYVTCEPCIMCAGALSLLGFRSVTFGCPNDKFGGNGSILSVQATACGGCGGGDGRPYPTRGGLLAAEAVDLLQRFYIAGNPKAPKPQRTIRSRPAPPPELSGAAAMQLG